MERHCLNSSFKYQKVDADAMKSQKNKLMKQEEDYINGISWPPRCYTCNFCKRVFRSAQALGGHMNVHRRDRALLRQLSPPTDDGQFTNLSLNLLHNPNPNSSSSSSSYSASIAETKKWVSSVDGVSYDPFSLKVSELKKSVEAAKPKLFEQAGRNVEDFSKVIRLDVEINTVFIDSKKDVDLELRLGYS